MHIPFEYWELLTSLVAGSEIIIDRPKGSLHPRYPEFIYPLDYGYLKNTRSNDGEGVDVWLGSLPDKSISSVICTVDIEERDVEIKLLLGCTPEETLIILAVHNQGTQAAFLINRCNHHQKSI